MIVRSIVESLADVTIVEQVVHDPDGIVAQLLGYRTKGQDLLRFFYSPVIRNGHTKLHDVPPEKCDHGSLQGHMGRGCMVALCSSGSECWQKRRGMGMHCGTIQTLALHADPL